MQKLTRRLTLAFLAGCLSGVSVVAQAADWPTSEIRIYVPASPGGSTDLVSRAVKPFLEKEVGVPVVIVNQTAGGGAVATNSVATAKPDGGTLLIHHALLHTTHVFGRSPLSYRDFTPLATFSEVNNVLATRSKAPFGNLKELGEYAKANPGKLKLASQLGGTTQVMGQGVARWSSGSIRVVDAGSEADRTTALLGDQVDLALLTTATAQQYQRAGDVKVLAVFNRTPDALVPEWPTAPANGLNVSFPLVFTLYAPKGMSADVSNRLATALGKFGNSAEFKAELQKVGTTPAFRDAKQAATFLDEEFTFVSDIIKSGSN